MVLLGLGFLGVLLGATPALGQENAPLPHVDVVQVSGWIDPVVADFITRSLHDSERGQAEAMVLQLDSPGAVTGVDGVVQAIRDAKVPVAPGYQVPAGRSRVVPGSRKTR